jgi:hypothetical protein
MTLWLDGQTGSTGQNKAECFDSLTVTCLGATAPPVMPFLEFSKAMERGIGYAGEGDALTAVLVGALASEKREEVHFVEGKGRLALVFPDEGPWILKPANSLQWHEAVFEWLDSHLQTD